MMDDANQKRASTKNTIITHFKNLKSYETDWANFSESLSRVTNTCSKCHESVFRVWELSYQHITLRCNSCKKKYNVNKNSINIALSESAIDKSFDELITGTLNCFTKIHNDDGPDFWGHMISSEYSHMSELYRPQRDGAWYRNVSFIPKNNIENNNSRSRHIPKQVRDFVFKRDNGKCVNCGEQNDIHFDHIIPHAKGGSNTVENIQLLCVTCNLRKGARIDG